MLYLALSENNLQVITPAGTQTLNFPPDVVRYQEVINKDAFEELITNFFARPQKHEAGIFLDPRLIYHKTMPAKNINPNVIKMEEEKFFSSVPIAELASANLVIHGKSEILLLSANKHIFKMIIDILTKKDWKIKFVVPLTIFFENSQNRELGYQMLQKFHKQKKLIKKFNFLLSLNEDKPHKKIIVSKNMFIFTTITLFSLLILLVTFFLTVNNSIKNSKQAAPVPTITPSPTPASSPTLTITPVVISKKEIKIQIFNGSGLTGEATKIKNRLNTLGFTNIQIGDAEGPKSNTTIVIFAEKTPQQYRDEILTELKKLFKTIETQEISTSDLYDVFITTGTSLN